MMPPYLYLLSIQTVLSMKYTSLIVIIAFSFFACKNDDVDPTSNPDNNNPNNDNNDSLLVINDTVSTTENTSITIDVTANDFGEEIVVSSITQPSNGVTTISGNNVVYTPNTGYVGSDSFKYEAIDVNENTDEGVVIITIEEEVQNNTPPTIEGSVNLSSNIDTEDISNLMSDADGDNVTIVSIEGATNGTVNVDNNTISYTPNTPTFFGSETL